MAIDIGVAAIDRIATAGTGTTYINKDNPANETGILTSIELYFKTTGSGVKVGTFSGSSTSWTNRDYETIGAVTAGSKQTFTGLSCDVTANDLLGLVNTGGGCAYDTKGSGGYLYKLGDQMGAGTQTYILDDQSKIALSCYATGESVVAVANYLIERTHDRFRTRAISGYGD